MTSSLYGGKGHATGMPSRQGLTGMPGSKIPRGYGRAQLQNFTNEQMDLFRGMFDNIGPESFLSRLAGGDESAFAETEAPAMRQFNEIMGGISSRFSGMGDTGGRHSSGFGHAMTSAGSNFVQDLAAKRQALMSQARQELFGMQSQLLGQKPYEQSLVKKKGNWLQQLLGGMAGGAVGAGTGYAMGGPMGALAGGATGFGSGYQGAQ